MIRTSLRRFAAGPALLALAMTTTAGTCISVARADDLQGALAAAYATNPDLAAARANQRATDEGVPIARAPGLPSLSGTATYTEFLRQGPNAFIAPKRLLTVEPSLSVPIYS
ncbi:MAG: TolC family protein, partial [Novosphingobium sp.]